MRLVGTCARHACALTVLGLALALVFVPSAGASHSFSDVPDGHPFHNEIGIFKDTNITAGCSPTEYCPSNNLQRQGMAAFITRALGLVVRPNEASQKGVPGSRVAMLDDDLTFVGTQDGALELSYNGVRGLRLEQGVGGAPNVIGGSSTNSVTPMTFAATIAGGQGNTASGDYSFAAGRLANAGHDGAFVWADSTDADFASTAANQFAVRASNGAKFVRGGNSFTASDSALQAEQQGDFGEAAWFRIGSSQNADAVVSLIKDGSGAGHFLECLDEVGGVPVSKCHINAAGTFVAGSDFAESLPALGGKRKYQPGDVLVMSRTRPGAVLRSRKANDPAVIGVYSTRPGVLGADKGGVTRIGKEEIPVAITGIVPVKVTAANGAILPGDLLVSSHERGRAMRAGKNPRVGTILGKALGALPRGRGTIKMLVMLR